MQKPVSQLSQRDIARASMQIEDRPGLLAVFRTAHNSIQTYALKMGLIENKIAFPYGVKQNSARDVWDAAKLEAELENLSCPVRWVMFLGYHTAQRIGDLLKLKWSSYDGEYIVFVQDKTGTPVKIPATPKLKTELDFRKPGAHTDYICEHYNEVYKVWQRMDYVWFAAQYRKLYPVGQYPRFHGIRHASATKLASLGASPHTIQAITGHKSLNSVMRYTREARKLIDSTELMKRF